MLIELRVLSNPQSQETDLHLKEPPFSFPKLPLSEFLQQHIVVTKCIVSDVSRSLLESYSSN